MNDINATLGLANLPHIADLLKKNRANAAYLNEWSWCPDIEPILSAEGSSNWLYTIRVKNGKKQEFMDRMKEVGIATSQVHNRNDTNSCVSEFQEPLPNLDQFEKEMVCVPVGWWVNTEQIVKEFGV
jgi:dTDP-4-amino-4,6-dideoxygalactose transaminase